MKLIIYFVSHKKPSAQSFAHNFGKCTPILKILLELKRREKALTINLAFVPLPVLCKQ